MPALDKLCHGAVADDLVMGKILLPDGLAVGRQLDGDKASFRMGRLAHGEDAALTRGNAVGVGRHTVILLDSFVQEVVVFGDGPYEVYVLMVLGAGELGVALLDFTLFLFLAYFADQIMVLVLKIAGTPYSWIVDAALPPIDFASFASTITVIVGCIASGSVSLIVLILVITIAWNYIKLLCEAAERYIMVGVLIYTAPMAFATGASENTSNIFSAWCRMLGGQLFLLIMNAWCLRLFVSMVGNFLATPLSF